MSGRSPVERWAGDFGRAYTDRNLSEAAVRAPAFREMVGGLGLGSVLEVGCNRGHNLAALAGVAEARLVGIDVNPYALDIARREVPAATFVEGEASALPFVDASFDLVFTSGVLIHVPPETLDAVLGEILRVSARWVLAVEYFAEAEEVVRYRGHDDLLWRRDFEDRYRRLEPGLRTVGSGYWDREHGFDRSHWWLLEKPE